MTEKKALKSNSAPCKCGTKSTHYLTFMSLSVMVDMSKDIRLKFSRSKNIFNKFTKGLF